MADRYWVGGTGNWDSRTTTNWSATSGGAGGASAPTYDDNVIFNSASNATAYTVTFAQGFVGTGGISGTTLTVTAVTSGVLTVGASINRNAATIRQPTSSDYIAGGTYIVNQLTGTTGGIGTYTVSVSQTMVAQNINAVPSCADITVAGPTSGALTIAGATNTRPSIYGSMTLAATNVVWSSVSEITLCASTTGKIITTNGVTIGTGTAQCMTFDGVGSWTLGSSLRTGFVSNSPSLRVNRGSFNTGNFSIITNVFNSVGTFTREINLGSSSVTVGQPNDASWVVTATGLTLNAGTSVITLSNFNAVFTGGGLTYSGVFFQNSGSVSQRINGANTFSSLTLNTRSSNTGLAFMQFDADQTITGALTMGVPAGTNPAFRRFLKSTVEGTQRTITVASVPAFSSADFKDIVIAGAAAPISGTSIGNAGNNSGITFSAPKTVYWNLPAGGGWGSSSVASWATTSGGSAALANLPLAQDIAIIENTGLNSGAIITNHTAGGPCFLFGNVDFTTRTLPMTLTVTGLAPYPNFYGSLLLSPAVTITGSTQRTGTAADATPYASGIATGALRPILFVSPTGEQASVLSGHALVWGVIMPNQNPNYSTIVP